MYNFNNLDLISRLYLRWEERKGLHPEESFVLYRWVHQDAEDRVWDEHEFKLYIEKSAGYIQSLGLKGGDVIGFQILREPYWLPLFLGALSQGLTVLLLNDSYTTNELEYCLNDAQATLAFLPSKHCEALKTKSLLMRSSAIRLLATEVLELEIDQSRPLNRVTDLSADSLAVIAYTSGTTGKPKGALIRHKDIIGTLNALHQAWEWSPEDRLVHTLPLFHIHGLFVAALGALWASAELLMLTRFDAQEALEAVEKYKGTVLMGVPTHHHRYLQIPHDQCPNLNSLRLVTSGSAPLTKEQFTEFKSKFGIDIVERYGMTEVGIVLSAPLHGPLYPGSVGFPLPGVQAKVCDALGKCLNHGEEGELHITSASLCLGYHQRPQATAEAIYVDEAGHRWMRTGDLAVQDQEGRFWLKGRVSEMIISGGLNVYPREVEAALLEAGHPWVAEAAVIGVPDPEWGERVECFLTTHDSLCPSHEQLLDLLERSKSFLAGYKRPKKLHWISGFPRNSMGKLQRFKLRERLLSADKEEGYKTQS